MMKDHDYRVTRSCLIRLFGSNRILRFIFCRAALVDVLVLRNGPRKMRETQLTSLDLDPQGMPISHRPPQLLGITRTGNIPVGES
jgi:hypothetical protein